jgi:hypothetical protein
MQLTHGIRRRAGQDEAALCSGESSSAARARVRAFATAKRVTVVIALCR